MARRRAQLPSADELFGKTKESRLERQEENVNKWDIQVPKDVLDVGTKMQAAPTTNPARPRAWTIGYNPNTQTLIIVFRDNTWWQYENVGSEMWIGLKNSGSTGKYLRTSGLDTWPDMGPADMEALSAGTREQISSTAESASRIQNSTPITDLRKVSAAELFGV